MIDSYAGAKAARIAAATATQSKQHFYPQVNRMPQPVISRAEMAEETKQMPSSR